MNCYAEFPLTTMIHSLMKKFIIVIFKLISGSSIDSLADSLDLLGPGTSAMFVEWGQEEELLENQYKILVGELPSPRSFKKVTAFEFVMTVLYKNPEISQTDIVDSIRRASESHQLIREPIANAEAAFDRIAEFITGITSLRDSVFSMFYVAIRKSIVRNGGIPDIQMIAATHMYRFQEKYADTGDVRFLSLDRTVSTINIWYLMCIRGMIEQPVPTSDQPCVFDRNTREWRMSRETVVSLFRYFVLTSIKVEI